MTRGFRRLNHGWPNPLLWAKVTPYIMAEGPSAGKLLTRGGFMKQRAPQGRGTLPGQALRDPSSSDTSPIYS